MRKITRIFVHCTASYQQTTTIKSLQNEFKAKGWSAPGYHWVIDTDGNVHQLLSEDKVANGVKGYNANSIHVAWIGGIDKQHPRGIDNRTERQKMALYDWVAKLKMKYPQAEILGHRDISPDMNHNGIVDPWEYIKACPCFEVREEYAELNKM